MDQECDKDTNCYWGVRYSRQRIVTWTRGHGNKRTSGDHLNYDIIEISQNTKKSPGDLKGLAFINPSGKLSSNTEMSQIIMMIMIIMDQRKLMTMHKALHSSNDVNKQYMSREEGGRGLASTEDCVDVSRQWLEDYIEKCRGRQITKNSSDDTRTSRPEITRNQKWEEKRKTVLRD